LIFHLISEKLFRSEDSMQKIVYALAILLMGGSLFLSTPAAGQLIPAAKKAPRVQITEGPELESARDNSAIIRWTSNNPGGSDEHFGVVHYGKNPKDLSQTAKSHIRLNQQHSYTVFRVRVDGLEPRTTYYIPGGFHGFERKKRRSRQPSQYLQDALRINAQIQEEGVRGVEFQPRHSPLANFSWGAVQGNNYRESACAREFFRTTACTFATQCVPGTWRFIIF
jgi:hypothetical protein